MNTVGEAFTLALTMMWRLDAELLHIVWLSLRVSLTAVLVGSLIGLPFGALLALTRFRGRNACIVVLNACMGLPPVVVGLIVYLILSRSGPLGQLGWLFTPAGMVVAQVVLITPIVAALPWAHMPSAGTSSAASVVNGIAAVAAAQNHNNCTAARAAPHAKAHATEPRKTA